MINVEKICKLLMLQKDQKLFIVKIATIKKFIKKAIFIPFLWMKNVIIKKSTKFWSRFLIKLNHSSIFWL